MSGWTGTGKTSAARILRRLVGCSKVGYEELNAASERGIDTIRDIESQAGMNPLEGSVKMWVLDEAHALTRDSQGALLKITEDPPEDVYLVLCTTNPEKLLPALIGRCKHLKFEQLDEDQLEEVLKRVCKEEKVELSKKVIRQLVEAADGSARSAINLLESIMDFEDEKEQLNCIVKQNAKIQAIEIARALVKDKPSWKEVATILRNVKEDPEKMRRMIMSYASSILLNGQDNPKMDFILTAFEPNVFDSGMPGFVGRCREVCANSRRI